MSATPTFKGKYQADIVPALKEKFQYKSVMEVPKLEKICLNQGLGLAVADKKVLEAALADMSIIAGQKAISSMSKKDISNFKLRKGMPIGARVTLRGDKMYEFLERLVAVAIPRMRDFRGINAKGFDGRGNYNMGITEQIIFPEIDIEKVNKILGMDITIVTSAKTNEEAHALLTEFGMPFKK
jgi:large subunit ribosomal protein L5